MQRSELSDETGLTSSYGDQIIGKLRDAGIVHATRGRGGGLKLAKLAGEVDVWQLFASVEDNWTPVVCLDDSSQCTEEAHCNAASAWGQIHQKMKSSLEAITLEDLQKLEKPNLRKNHERTQSL